MDIKEIQRVIKNSRAPPLPTPEQGALLAEILSQEQERVKGTEIIHLGQLRAGDPLGRLLHLDISSYTLVDPFREEYLSASVEGFLFRHPEDQGKLRVERGEAVGCLQQRRERSSTVVSIGMLNSSVIGAHLLDQTPVLQYEKELALQIYRVTPAAGISYHLGIDSVWKNALLQVGFISFQDGSLFLKER